MKEKIKIILIIAITAIVSIGTTATALFVTNASNITLNSSKTNETTVEGALNELYNNMSVVRKLMKQENGNYKTPTCIRAAVLHIESCLVTSSGCREIFNYNDSITYGNATTTSGILNTGDAFTCDVNGDGIFNEQTERFYYVSDLYTGGETSSATFDANIAVLIYYSNVIKNGITVTANNTTGVAYNFAKKNYEGPLTAINHIPSKDVWSKLSINESRQIRSQSGTSTAGGTAITFSGYTNKAARLLTTQEISKGCEITVGNSIEGELDTNKCRFLLENTKYANPTYITSYWLETPLAWSNNIVWHMNGEARYVGYNNSELDVEDGIRPAIEVAKSDISY